MGKSRINLNEKIEASIAIIRKGEKLALLMQPEKGYYIGFSGGKDSQVVLELVRMAGVKYTAVYNVTTNDPPENVRFIRDNYPDVSFSHPDENFFKIVEKNGLPTRTKRFCCVHLKERGGIGFVTITGVRHEESVSRSEYQPVMKKGKSKKNAEVKDLDRMEELNFQCVNGNDKFMLYPILDWTESDVWQFIARQRLPYNPCYDFTHRVGCMFCPYSSERQIRYYSEKYPKFYKTLVAKFDNYLNYRKLNGGGVDFDTAEEYIEWWLSNESVDNYKEKNSQIEINFEQ